MTNLIKRDTIEDILSKREKSIEQFKLAYTKLKDAQEHCVNANSYFYKTSLISNSFNVDNQKFIFNDLPKIPDKKVFFKQVINSIDRNIWAYIVELTELDNLMDKKSKDELRQSLIENPPEVTLENVASTIQNFALKSTEIFYRGIAECFSSLDRRFRSHDGWKIGSRVIISNALTEYGSWNYHNNKRDSIIDIERTFSVLDNLEKNSNPKSNPNSIIHLISESRKGWKKQRSECENEYFKIRCYENGNIHLWFKRDDLLQKVNKMLAEYYGEVIPHERDEQTDDEILKNTKTNIAKNYGLFPTPEELVSHIIDRYVYLRKDIDILEPSAGYGNIAKKLLGDGRKVDCVEIQKSLAERLQNENLYNNVYNVDFLKFNIDKKYDLIFMNPPFDRGLDISHVNHALNFLKDGGCLVAIMSASTEFKEDKISIAFRNKIKKMNGKFYDLPKNSFSSVGTNVNTLLLKIGYKNV